MARKSDTATPLIERFLVIGVQTEEIIKILSNKNSELSDLQNSKIKVLEEYKSNEMKDSVNENYIENIAIVKINLIF
jgi:hypothetical protein